MARQDVTDTDQPPGPLFAAGRLMGFTLFAVLGIGVFGAVTLLPAYAGLQVARYERDYLAAEVADLACLVATRDRQIRAMPTDLVYTKRMLAANEGLTPAGEVVLIDPEARRVSPADAIRYKRHPRPAPPVGPVVQMADRLQRPPVRRGLCVLAAMSLAAAMFLFSPPQKYRPQSA